MVGMLFGDDRDELAERRRQLGRILGMRSGVESWLAQREGYWIQGGPERLRERWAAYADAGCQQLVLEVFDASDIRQVEQAARALSLPPQSIETS
jgi:hypothetical protein